MFETLTKKELDSLLKYKLEAEYGTNGLEASDKVLYEALASVIKDLLANKRRKFTAKASSRGQKKVYYICMEYLLGRSLKNNLYNLGLERHAANILKKYDANLEGLYAQEPDAGLGNGGLGRLAACFMDALATREYPATGYCICYEYGIFKQKLIDGWQTEMPDNWLPGGEVWLTPRPDRLIEVKFGGEVEEFWDYGYHHVNYKNYRTVEAVPYDMYISGYNTEGVSKLRLFKAKSPGLDMELFNSGDYIRALSQNAMAEVISKVLYPNDNHPEGKQLRLQQQYFLCCAAINDIVHEHVRNYDSLDNLPNKVAIHINDTHPAMAILELMRILLDDCGYNWEKAYDIVTHTFAYTNHTIMAEALEVWNEDLFRSTLPRLHQILVELNNRFCKMMFEITGDNNKVGRMSMVRDHSVKMANLAVVASHSVNGVSKIHSKIIRNSTFQDFHSVMPHKFKNVTNGIASRRWLYQSNPDLTQLCVELIGHNFIGHMEELEKLRQYQDDPAVLDRLAEVKLKNKERFAKYVQSKSGAVIDPHSLFDVQVKRLHEYKRQHMNALHIISLYQKLMENPALDMQPHTFIFGAKAAPGYYLAKQIIRLLCALGREFEKNPIVKDKLRVVYLEDYSVTLSERLMPASEISQQISLAGTEASGTGNMKLMLNGAVTIGTLDGANIEIMDACGGDNIITFGLTTEEVEKERGHYHPMDIYNTNEEIRKAVDLLHEGIAGDTFDEIAHSLKNQDPYMVLRDFESYKQAERHACKLYTDPRRWNKMSLNNIAGSGRFSADRAIEDYARDIWNCRRK